jgi:hypothetical protein
VDAVWKRRAGMLALHELKTAVWSGFQQAKSPKPALDLPILALLTKNIEKKP